MLVPETNTRVRCTGDDESAPKTRDSTRRRCTARSKTRQPTGLDSPPPRGWRPAAPRPARRSACKRGAVHAGAMTESACPGSCPSSKAHVVAGRAEGSGEGATTADRRGMPAGPHPPDLPTDPSPHPRGGRSPIACSSRLLSGVPSLCRRRHHRRPSPRLSSRSRPHAYLLTYLLADSSVPRQSPVLRSGFP